MVTMTQREIEQSAGIDATVAQWAREHPSHPMVAGMVTILRACVKNPTEHGVQLLRGCAEQVRILAGGEHKGPVSLEMVCARGGGYRWMVSVHGIGMAGARTDTVDEAFEQAKRAWHMQSKRPVVGAAIEAFGLPPTQEAKATPTVPGRPGDTGR